MYICIYKDICINTQPPTYTYFQDITRNIFFLCLLRNSIFEGRSSFCRYLFLRQSHAAQARLKPCFVAKGNLEFIILTSPPPVYWD